MNVLLRIFHCGSFSAARSLCDRLARNYLSAEVIWWLVLCAYLVDLVRWQKLLNCHLHPFTVLHYIWPAPVAGSMPYRGPHVASPGRHASTSRPYSPRLCRGTPYRVRRGRTAASTRAPLWAHARAQLGPHGSHCRSEPNPIEPVSRRPLRRPGPGLRCRWSRPDGHGSPRHVTSSPDRLA